MKIKTVYTYGVWDLLHVGHLRLLQEAKALGDKLIVCVFTDAVATSFKRTPIISQDHRLEMIQALHFVDEVVLQGELIPDINLKRYRPDILAKGPGANWEKGKKPPGFGVMKEIGGKVVFLDYHDIISTTHIIEKCKERK